MTGRIKIVFIGLLLISLAGCSNGNPTAEMKPKTDDKAAAEIKEPIVFMGMIGIGGRLDELGKRDIAAMEIATEQVNRAGGILGRSLKMVFYDEQDTSPTTIRDSFAKENPFAVIGFDSSDTALLYHPVIMQEKKLLMISGAGSPALTDGVAKDRNTNKYLFRNGNYTTYFAEPSVVFVNEILKAKNYLYLSQGNAFGQALEKVLEEMMAKQGIKSLGAEYFTREEKDFTAVMQQIRQKNPDVIVSYLGLSGVPFVQAYYDHKLDIPIYEYGLNSLELESQVKPLLGEKLAHIVVPQFAADVAVTPKTKPFYEEFRQRFGENPTGYFEVRAADAVAILANAINTAGSLDNDKVITVLEQKRFEGIAGTYAFDPVTHQAQWGDGYLQGLISQYQNGKLIPIWPERVKSADFVPAPWWKLPAK